MPSCPEVKEASWKKCLLLQGWLMDEVKERQKIQGIDEWWIGARKNPETNKWEWADGGRLNSRLL